MNWFLYSLTAILFWSGSDLFSKMGTDPRDKYSHLRMLIMVGAVMGIHGTVMLIVNHRAFDPMSIVRYLPVSAMYIISMAIGYVGLRYLDLSVSSPVCNSSGAVAAVLARTPAEDVLLARLEDMERQWSCVREALRKGTDMSSWADC